MDPTQQPGQEEQNPFLEMLQKRRMQQGGQTQGGDQGMPDMSSMMGGGMAPQAAAAQQSMMQPTQPLSTEKGQSGDTTKPLTQAMSAIHTYLSQSTTQEDITTGRSIIALLSQLIMRDQKRAGENDQRMQAMMSQQGGQQGMPQQAPQGPVGE